MRSLERQFDGLAFEIFQRMKHSRKSVLVSGSTQNLGEIFGRQQRLLSKYQRVLDRVFQLADVSWPGVSLQHVQRFGSEGRFCPAMHRRQPREKMRSQRNDVGTAFAQWRNMNCQNIQPEKKVLAKAAGLHSFGYVRICQRHQSRFHAQRFRAAEPFETALFENAE